MQNQGHHIKFYLFMRQYHKLGRDESAKVKRSTWNWHPRVLPHRCWQYIPEIRDWNKIHLAMRIICHQFSIRFNILNRFGIREGTYSSSIQCILLIPWANVRIFSIEFFETTGHIYCISIDLKTCTIPYKGSITMHTQSRQNIS